MNITTGKVLSAQKVVVYGPEGIGKSTFASKFPNLLFSDTEGSTKRLDVRRFDKPTSAEMLTQQIEYIKAHPDICSTYVIDTADWAEKIVSSSLCARCKKTGIEDFGYGKGYTYLAEDFGKILNHLEDLISLGINVVVTAHAQMRKFEQPEEVGAYDRWELKLTKQTAPMLKEWADCVLFVNYKTIVEKTSDNKYKATGGRRVMYTEHNSCWDAKNRYELPAEVDFDYSVIARFIPDKSGNATAVVNNTPASQPKSEIDNIVDNEQPKPEPKPKPKTTVPDGIPKALADLMLANDVSEEDVQLVVSQRGYFPIDTKIADYGNDFIEGCLIGAWSQMFELIMQNKDLPFN